MGDLTSWLTGLPATQAEALKPYFDRARQLVPQAVEGTSYAMPALIYRSRGLVAVRPTRAGYSAYPYSGEVVTEVMASFPGWDHTKGSIHFTAERLLPTEVFDALVLASKDGIDRRLDRRR